MLEGKGVWSRIEGFTAWRKISVDEELLLGGKGVRIRGGGVTFWMRRSREEQRSI